MFEHIVVKNSVQKIIDYVLGIALLNQDLINVNTFVTTILIPNIFKPNIKILVYILITNSK